MKRITKIKSRLSIIVFTLLLVTSCSTTSTIITGSWEKPGTEKMYDKIVVEALTPDVATRAALEQQMIAELKEKGVNAFRSGDDLLSEPVEDDNEKQEILETLQKKGADGILTISIIDREEESRYVPGPSPYAPYRYYPYYSSFWGYYNYWHPYFYSPGYYTLENVYYIETNLFDAESEELIWSAQSKTYEQKDLKAFSKDYTKQIARELEKEGIIAK